MNRRTTDRMFHPPDQGDRFGAGDDRATGRGTDEWMVTWADAITVLLGFFVLLFSLADVDDLRFEDIRDALSAEVQVPDPLPLPVAETRTGPELAKRLIEVLQAATFSGGVRVERLPAGVVIELPADDLFDATGAIREDDAGTLATLAWELQQPGMGDYLVEVQAFDDWEAATARSAAFASFLRVQGVPERRLRATAFSALQPQLMRTRGGSLPPPDGPRIRILLERP